MAINEVKFLCRCTIIPLRSGKLKAFRNASRLWLKQVQKILMPRWLINLTSQKTKLGAVYELLKVVGRISHFIQNCVMLKFLLGLLFAEFCRIKRIITKAVERSRRLRVSDEEEQN